MVLFFPISTFFKISSKRLKVHYGYPVNFRLLYFLGYGSTCNITVFPASFMYMATSNKLFNVFNCLFVCSVIATMQEHTE